MSQPADNSKRAELRAILAAKGTIPARLIDDLMASDNREAQADAYDCLRDHWKAITPEPEAWFTSLFILNFLFRSITEPVTSDDLESNLLQPYEAARELLGWLRANHGRDEQRSFVANLIQRVDQTFLVGDESVCDCLEMGFLEHALEYPELRTYFAHWQNHPKMKEAHSRALEWGLAHEQRGD